MWEPDRRPHCGQMDRDSNEMPRGTRHATVARHDPDAAAHRTMCLRRMNGVPGVSISVLSPIAGRAVAVPVWVSPPTPIAESTTGA